jgi:hypothetical protein
LQSATLSRIRRELHGEAQILLIGDDANRQLPVAAWLDGAPAEIEELREGQGIERNGAVQNARRAIAECTIDRADGIDRRPPP